MQVEKANTNDAEAILALQKLAYLSEAELHDDFEIPPLTQTLVQLIAEFDVKRVLKIVNNGSIIACGQVYMQQECCHISRMAVHPNFQGKGLGAALMSALENQFPQAERYELFTGNNSTRNLSMYQRRGYVPFKEALLGKTKVIFLRRNNV